MHKIIDIQLARFSERLARREVSVELTPAAKDYLAEVGWDTPDNSFATDAEHAARADLGDDVYERLFSEGRAGVDPA